MCILGPKARTGKTLTSERTCRLPRAAWRAVALIGPRLQFRRRRAVPRAAAGGRRSTTSRVPWRADWDKLSAFMAQHSSGVYTLIAPRRPDQASAVGAELLREIYSILRQNYDWVIVDTPPGFTAEVITSIDHSTDIVMVGMLDSLSLKNTKLGLETLELMKYDTDHIYLLLNRAHSRVGISHDVEAVPGERLTGSVS